MKCKLNLKAPNGKNSKLFVDLVATAVHMDEAIDTYFYTQTDAFKDNYKGKLDSNGEPMYSEIAKDSINDADYSKVELGESAEAYKKILKAVPKAIKLLGSRIDYVIHTKGPKDNHLESLKEAKKTLESSTVETSIPKFLEMARKHTKYLLRNMKAAAGKEGTEFKTIANYYKVAQTYSMAEEIRKAINQSPETREIFDDIVNVDEIIGNIREIENLYYNETINMLANEFHKRDKTWSISEIKQNLRNAPKDVGGLDKMLQYLGDSSDKSISMVARIMMEAENNIKRSSFEFTKVLTEKLKALESTGKKGEDMFKSLLVKNHMGEWHVIDPEAKHTNGVDPLADVMAKQLETIKGDSKAMDFLYFYHDEMTKLNSMLPASGAVGTRVPTVMREQWQLMEGKTLKEKYNLVTDNVKNKFERSNLDTERGLITDAFDRPLRKIPTFFNQRYNSLDYDPIYKKELDANLAKGMEAEDAETAAANVAEAQAIKILSEKVSLDLVGSLQAFHAMAMNYSVKNELLYIFDAAESVISSDYRQYARVDGAGRTAIDEDGSVKTKGGAVAKSAAALTKFMDMQLYGQKELDLGYFDVFGMKIDTNATLRALGNSTSLINQAFNVLGGIANLGTGEYNTFMEAVGNEFFSVKDMVKASAEYKNDLGHILGDIGQRIPKSKVNLLDEHYSFLQDFNREQLSASEKSKVRRLLRSDTLYFMQNITEHFMQMQGAMALMNATEMFTKDGTSAGTLLDNHKVENETLKIPTDLYIKERDGSLVKYNITQQDRIAAKTTALLRKLHGNYSSKTANEMHHDARTALVMKFRGWMYEGFKRRFTKKRDFHMLEQEMEGFYTTGAKAIWNLAKDLRTFNLQLAKEDWAKLTSHEKANIKRMIVETSSIMLLAISGAMLGKAGKMLDDEFDSDDITDRMIMGSFATLNYEVNRLYTEVAAYINPAEFTKLMRTPAASISVLENLMDVIIQTYPQNIMETYQTGWKKGDSKLIWKAGKLIPGYKQIRTLTPEGIEEKMAYFNN